jgi:preprotein translocase subunit SecF
MTSLTTLIALGALYLFGGPVIASFVDAMIFGIVIGTYSSIFIAAPLLIYLNLRVGRPSSEEAESGKPAEA